VKPTLLLVDDEPNLLAALSRLLVGHGFAVATASSAADALVLLAERAFDAIVSDESMGGRSGCSLLAEVASKYPSTVRILLTGHASLTVAQRAINEGHVHRLLFKPIAADTVAETVHQAIAFERLSTVSRKLADRARRHESVLARLEEESPGITRLERDGDGAILIEGESLDELVGNVDRLSRDLGRGRNDS
jgi:DNA-binding NtrC family response regulator